MALTSFADVQNFFNDFITANNIDIAGSPHLAFWNTLSYQDFISGNVPGVTDPNTQQPVPILIKGNGAGSNIIQALLGTGIFDPNTGIGQMPYEGPYFKKPQIQELQDWITAGCPE